MIVIAGSSKDTASSTIKKQIIKNCSFEKTAESFQNTPIFSSQIDGKAVKLATLRDETTYAQDITDFFTDAELIVFMSRHSSASGTPTLSVHTPGNLKEAKLGGISRNVSISPANSMREALKTMARMRDEMQLEYEVCYEVTHHGPSLDVPAMFVELGSSFEQWKDTKAAKAVAHATIESISSFDRFPAKAVLGIGGPHYNEKFTKIALNENLAFGHMIPKYAIAGLDTEMLKQCIEKTLEKVELIVLDWKGIKGAHKSRLVKMLEKIGTPFQKV